MIFFKIINQIFLKIVKIINLSIIKHNNNLDGIKRMDIQELSASLY